MLGRVAYVGVVETDVVDADDNPRDLVSGGEVGEDGDPERDPERDVRWPPARRLCRPRLSSL